jgi:hypothetical protein
MPRLGRSRADSRATIHRQVRAPIRRYRPGMTMRRNGIVLDEDGPWTAACYLRGDSDFTGTQHGVYEQGTLCGLAASVVDVVRNPFYGDGNRDCKDCAARLHELAVDS